MTDQREEQLPREKRQQGQALLIRVSMASAVGNAFIGSLSALFILGLGATPFHVGLMETVTNLDKAVRLGAVQLMVRLGKVALLSWGQVALLVPIAMLAVLAVTGQPDTRTIWMALVVLGLRDLLKQVGNTAWWPLVQDNTAGDALGAFLVRMRLRQRSLDLVLPLAAGWYLGTQPSSQRFALLFALGLVAAGVAAWLARGITERPMPEPEQGLWRRLFEVVRLPSIRRYSFYIMMQTCVQAASFPFWVIVLTGQGMAAIYFVWMISVMALGNISGLLWWGRLVDGHGSRPVLTLVLLAKAVLGLAWLGLPTHPVWLVVWAAGLYLVWGLLEGGNQISQNRAMVDVVPAAHQGEAFALMVYAAAFGGGIGGVLGGVAFQWVSRLALDTTWGDPRLLYLAGMQLGLIGVWYLSTFLAGYNEQTPLWRLLRRQLARLGKQDQAR